MGYPGSPCAHRKCEWKNSKVRMSKSKMKIPSGMAKSKAEGETRTILGDVDEIYETNLVGASRFERPTSCSQGRRANQAALRPDLWLEFGCYYFL